jgi:uracil-DNA glycosylase
VRAVAAAPGPRVFVLWGRHAAAYASFVHRPEHRVLTSAHPSPLSAYRGFFGSRPFSEANAWLTAHGADPIAW